MLTSQNTVCSAFFRKLVNQCGPFLQSGCTLQGKITKLSSCHEDKFPRPMRYPATLRNVKNYFFVVFIVNSVGFDISGVVVLGSVSNQLSHSYRHLGNFQIIPVFYASNDTSRNCKQNKSLKIQLSYLLRLSKNAVRKSNNAKGQTKQRRSSCGRFQEPITYT